MQRLFAALLLNLIAFTLLAAPIPKGEKKKSDEQLLEGKWEVVSMDSGTGQQKPNSNWESLTLSYKSGVLNTGTNTRPGWEDAKVKLDSTSNPKVMEVERGQGRVVKYIYEIDGDTLKWCEWNKSDTPPDNFTGGGRHGKNSVLFKRAKE
jgi:uncharacterized protein (TIGR03067 family)